LAFNLISVLIKRLSLWQGDCCASGSRSRCRSSHSTFCN